MKYFIKNVLKINAIFKTIDLSIDEVCQIEIIIFKFDL